MNGFNWFDKRGVEGVGFVRTLRTLLTNNLPKLLPHLGVLTRTRWDDLLAEQKVVDGMKNASNSHSAYPTIPNRHCPCCNLSHDDEHGGPSQRQVTFWRGSWYVLALLVCEATSDSGSQ